MYEIVKLLDNKNGRLTFWFLVVRYGYKRCKIDISNMNKYISYLKLGWKIYFYFFLIMKSLLTQVKAEIRATTQMLTS